MKVPLSSFLFALLLLPVAAQDIAPKDTERDPVLTALLEEETRPEDGPDVTVDLNAPSDQPDTSPAGPVLVTGTPPSDLLLAGQPAEAPAAPPAPKGVSVQIEGGSAASPVSPEEIRLLAPFPAKPLDTPPVGWRLIQPKETPPYSKKVELAGGSEITLKIRPHVLVPDVDSSTSFHLAEPGFNPSAQYDQRDTVGAILADSIVSLDEQSDRLDAASQRLRELLSSLPADSPPPPSPEAVEP